MTETNSVHNSIFTQFSLTYCYKSVSHKCLQYIETTICTGTLPHLTDILHTDTLTFQQ